MLDIVYWMLYALLNSPADDLYPVATVVVEYIQEIFQIYVKCIPRIAVGVGMLETKTMYL